MKKLIAVICVLLVIFLGMYAYKTNISKKNITVSEVEKIQEFISKIYLWQEVSEEALPKFDNINNAPDLWTWEVVKKNLEQFELTYEEIQAKAKEIFGEKFTKQFPKEGYEFIYYDENYGKYLITGKGLDTLEDMFFVKNIIRTNTGYEVEIIEYLEDYSDETSGQYIYIRNLNLEKIATIKNTDSESVKIEKIKENIDKFSIKKINIEEIDRKNVCRKCKMRHLGQSNFVSFLCRRMRQNRTVPNVSFLERGCGRSDRNIRKVYNLST